MLRPSTAEYGWDDYKGLDVKGKAVIVRAGDPPVTDPNDPSKLDAKMFMGPELSFYGRAWSVACGAQGQGESLPKPHAERPPACRCDSFSAPSEDE